MRLSSRGSGGAVTEGFHSSSTPVSSREERGRKLHSHKPKARRKKCSKSSQGRVALPRPFPLQRQTILSISAEYCEKRLRVVFQTPPNKRSEAEVRGAIQVIEYLSSFYRGLPPETRRMMAAAMGITAVQTGQVLHSHNAPPQALYIVVRGSVGIYIRRLRVRTLRTGDAFGYGTFNIPGSRAVMDEAGTCLEILSSDLSEPSFSLSESRMEILQGDNVSVNKILRPRSLAAYTQSRSLTGMLNPEADRAPSSCKSRDRSQDKSLGSLSPGSVNNLPVIVPTPRVSNHRLKHLASTLSHRVKAARAQEKLGTRPFLRDSQHLASRKSLEHAISQERIKAGGVEHDLGPLTAAAERTRRRIMILKAREERWTMGHGDSLFSDNEWTLGIRSTMRSDSLQYESRETIASSSLRLSSSSSSCEADIPLSSRDRTRESCQEGVGDDAADEDEAEDEAENGEREQDEDWASASLWTVTPRPVTVSTPLTWRTRSHDQPRPISTVQKCPKEASDRSDNRSPRRRKTHPAALAREAVVSGDGGSGGRRNRGQLSMRTDLRATAEQVGPSLPSLIQNLAVLNGVRLFASEDVFNGLQVREIEREKVSILSKPDSTWKVKRDVDMDCFVAHAAALGGRREPDKEYIYRQSDPGTHSGEGCKSSDMYFLARNWRIGKDDGDLPSIESVQSSIAAMTMSAESLRWPTQSEMKA